MSEKRKILFVRPSMGFGGADRVTLNILQGFDRNLFHCDLALMKKKGELINEVPKDIEIYKINGANIVAVCFSLRKLIEKLKPNIIYSTSGGSNISIMLSRLLIFNKSKYIWILSERSNLQAPGKNKVKEWFLFLFKKLLYRNADYVTAVSNELKESLINRLSVDRSKAFKVNNIIVNDSFRRGLVEEFSHKAFDGSLPVILAVGRFIPLKDYDMLFRAFQIVNKEVKCNLFILGDGPLLNYYQEKASQHEFGTQIYFGGFDVNPFKYMRRADLFVLSSQHEGMPGVLLQAMASGLPCVSTNCKTGPSEVITDGVNGFLTPVGDEHAMAIRLIEILKDPVKRKFLGENALASISEYHENEALNTYFNFIK